MNKILQFSIVLLLFSACSESSDNTLEQYLANEFTIKDNSYKAVAIINLEGCSSTTLYQLEKVRSIKAQDELLIIMTGEVQDHSQKELLLRFEHKPIFDPDQMNKKYEINYSNGILYFPQENEKSLFTSAQDLIDHLR